MTRLCTTALALLLFSLLASPVVAAPPAINASDPQHFLWNSKQWYPTGYTPGLNAIIGTNSYDVDPSGTYYKKILADMANSNVKLIRQVFFFGQPDYVPAVEGDCSVAGISRVPLTLYQRTGPGTATDGRLKYDLTKFNQSYFNHYKNFVAEASAKGIVVIVDIFDSWHLNQANATNNCNGPRGWNYDAYYTNNNINGVVAATQGAFHPSSPSTSPTSVYYHQKELIKKLVQEIGSYENIIWSVANEVEHNFQTDLDSPEFTAWKNNMVNEIRAAESANFKPAHLIMQADLPDHRKAGGNDNFLVYPILSGADGIVRDLFNARQGWSMPLIADNDGGTPSMDSADGKRRKAWASLTSGGHMTWFGHLMDDLAVWNDAKHVNGRKYLGYVTKFVDGYAINLDGMTRMDAQITSGGVQKGWLYGRSGDELIAYMDASPIPAGCPASPSRTTDPEKCFPEGDSTGSAGLWPGVNSYTLGGLPATFTANWFNTRNGICRLSTFGTGPTATFTLPAANTDWALYIKAGTSPFRVSAPIPAPQWVPANSTTELGVCVVGTTSATFVWQFKPVGSSVFTTVVDGGRFSGATTQTLKITGIQSADAGTYRCLVSNGTTQLNSGPATINVTP